jgi:Cupin
MAEEITMQTKSNNQTPEMTRHDLLVSLTPGAIEWQPVFEGIEIAVFSRDSSKAGSRFVIRAKHRDGLIVPPHWHSFHENITVISGTWVMGLGEKYDLPAAREFPAGSYIVVPKKVPHFALSRGKRLFRDMVSIPWTQHLFALGTIRDLVGVTDE